VINAECETDAKMARLPVSACHRLINARVEMMCECNNDLNKKYEALVISLDRFFYSIFDLMLY